MAIVVDGIIGAGKTTIARMLSDEFGFPIYEELTDDKGGQHALENRMLDRFYADQNRWSAITQVMFLNERFRDLKAIERNGQQAILDRSIYGDEIFAKTINKRGNMLDDELRIYQELLGNMLEHIRPPELLIYLDVSVETALQRIKARSRGTEAEMIPKDYMEDLRDMYEKWFEAFDLCPKIRVDLNECALDYDNRIHPEVKEKIICATQKIL